MKCSRPFVSTVSDKFKGCAWKSADAVLLLFSGIIDSISARVKGSFSEMWKQDGWQGTMRAFRIVPWIGDMATVRQSVNHEQN